MEIDDKISFNMNDMLSIINDIGFEERKTFEKLTIEKVTDNVRKWIVANPHHNFPKSQNAWDKLLFSQFGIIKVLVDPISIINLHDDISSEYHCQINILKERIDKYLSKKKNADIHKNDYFKSIKIIRSFCKFKQYVDHNKVLECLIHNKIINDVNYNVHSNIWIDNSKKRDFDKLVDSSDVTYDKHSYELNISSLNDIKRKRK